MTRTPREPTLLRLATAGNVDDGKSTLIGRLLLDTGSVPRDELEHAREASRRLGSEELDLALLTDGLRSEREQRITIDVAYRYFATPRRSFIIADSPGHLQYTRNMVTGASSADLALLVVDAAAGVRSQTRRHAFIASLLGITQAIVVVTKMDRVGWSQERFLEVQDEVQGVFRRLTLRSTRFVPVSGLTGDNVVKRSQRLGWYQGGTLLEQLELAPEGGRRNVVDFRFPVQLALRPGEGFRGFAGTVASGRVRAGDEVVVLPSGVGTRIREVLTYGGPREEAGPGEAVTLTLTDEVDVARGDMIVRPRNLPHTGTHLEAYLCWMDEEPLNTGRTYLLQHTTRQVNAVVEGVDYRIDVDTFRRERVEQLVLNDIGRVELRVLNPIFFDSYRVNTVTGSLILVDPTTHRTVAAGMIRGAAQGVARASPNVTWEGWNIPREEREARAGHRAMVVWFVGLPAAGKTTLARAVERRLFAQGVGTMLLDGDQLRYGLSGDLGFSPTDRRENLRRAGEVARLFFQQGSVVLGAFVSPFQQDRAELRARFPENAFLEVHVTAPAQTLRDRDPKGLYRQAEAGEITGFTGVDAPFEAPVSPEFLAETHLHSEEELAQRLVEAILSRIRPL